MTALILLTIYGLSVWGAYKFIQTAYSKGGVFSNLVPNITDFLMVILPFTSSALAFIFISGNAKRESKPQDFSKFFNIKNNEKNSRKTP